jgi:hypothetical protein
VDENCLLAVRYDDGKETTPVDNKNKLEGPSEGTHTMQSNVRIGTNTKAVAFHR